MSTPAPDIESLFDFETQIDECLAGIFAPICTAYFAGNDTEINGSRIDVISQVDGIDNVGGLPLARYGNSMWPQAFTGKITISIISDRKLDNDFQTIVRRQIRKTMLPFYQSINASNLPWLEITFMQEAGASRMVDEAHDADVQEMVYNLRFGIRDTAWPENP